MSDINIIIYYTFKVNFNYKHSRISSRKDIQEMNKDKILEKLGKSGKWTLNIAVEVFQIVNAIYASMRLGSFVYGIAVYIALVVLHVWLSARDAGGMDELLSKDNEHRQEHIDNTVEMAMIVNFAVFAFLKFYPYIIY